MWLSVIGAKSLSVEGAAEPSGSPVELPSSVIQFFDEHCYDCHNSDDREGELDLESLSFSPADRSDLKRWILIHDRVKAHEMPPRGEPEGRKAFLETLEETLHQASVSHQRSKGRVRSRRLNRIEFENTLHDLLGIDLPIVDLLPEDVTQEGFSNVAEAQPVSYHLLEKYLDVVDLSLEEAFRRATEPKPEFKRHLKARVLADDFSVKARRDRRPIFRDGYAVAMACNNNYHGRMDATTVPETGWYRLKIKAKAFNPPPGRGVWTQIRSGVCAAKAPRLFWVGHFLAERELKEFVFDAWMIKGHRLEIRPGDRTLKLAPGPSVNNGTAVNRGGIGTAIQSIEIERIYRGNDRERSTSNVFPSLKVKDGGLVSQEAAKDMEALLMAFAERAFRRPVSAESIHSYLSLAEHILDETGSLREALFVGYRAVLSSPRFLFFREDLGGLDEFALASRLSYFLWSRAPDEELWNLARERRLSEPEVLADQVDRLLGDARSAAFVQNFSDHWLDLKDIDFTTPDSKLYPEFDNVLKHSMLEETRAFLRELIDQNESVTNLIDSDFAMLNERLAKHYRIEGVKGPGIRRVALTGNEHRGGILTHGSVLKVTANGTTTSPIIRGVWVLEKMLAQHVPPPPDDVPAVEPDIRGAVSIRDQLEKHRSTKSCMACHKKIDPPGFALENFDVIGGWRKNYRTLKESGKRWDKGPRVDSSYQMADGRVFEGLEGFRRIVLQDPQALARNVLEKLLVYSTGASIEFADRREIDVMLSRATSTDFGFRSLIHEVVQSQVFRKK